MCIRGTCGDLLLHSINKEQETFNLFLDVTYPVPLKYQCFKDNYPIMVKKQYSGVRQSVIKILAWQFTDQMTLEKFLNFSKPQFPHCIMKLIKPTCWVAARSL